MPSHASVLLLLALVQRFVADATVFVPSFSTYPGYTGDLAVAGSVTIADASGNTTAKQTLFWSLTGLDLACIANAGESVTNACGVHVHTGTSCDSHADVGGHHYNSALRSDPWALVTYESSSHGSSLQKVGIDVVTGLLSRDLVGRVVVVHALASGARIACGVIGTETGAASPVSATSFAPYPGYAGNLQVAGTVTVVGTSGTDISAKQTLTWSLSGLDKACVAKAGERVTNACGIHVHSGTSCDSHAGVGGHYYSSVLQSDPWAKVTYVVSSDGSSHEEAGIDVVTGLSNGDIAGRVMVVHALASGARIACGVITEVVPSLLSICVGFDAEIPNTDIGGTLLKKVWSPNSGGCCGMCENTPGCEGYVFHLDQCYLKKDFTTASYKAGALTSLKSSRQRPPARLPACPGFGAEMPDTDMSGTLLKKVWSPNSGGCCGMCENTPGCEGYVFHLDQCYLKKDLAGGYYKPGAFTSMRSLMCVNFEAELPDTDVEGVLIKKVWSPKSELCCEFCNEVDACEGYVFHLDQCYLKTDLKHYFQKLGAFTRIKSRSHNRRLQTKPTFLV